MDHTGSPVPGAARTSVLVQSLGLLFRHPLDYLVFTLVPFAPGFTLVALFDYIFFRAVLHGPSSPTRFGLAMAGYAQSAFSIFVLVLTAGFASVLVAEAMKAHLDGRTPRLGLALRRIAPVVTRLTAALLIAAAVANAGFALFPPLGLLALCLFCQVPQVFSSAESRLLPGLRQSVGLVLRAPLETGLVLGFAFLYLLVVTVVRYAMSIPAALTLGYFGLQVVFGLLLFPAATWALVALNTVYLRSTHRL